MEPSVDFDFIFEPLFMRRLLRMLPSFMVPVPVPIVPGVVMVPLFMVPVAGVVMVPLFMVPVAGVDIVPAGVPVVGAVVGVVWAKAALAQRAKAAARKREVVFMCKE